MARARSVWCIFDREEKDHFVLVATFTVKHEMESYWDKMGLTCEGDYQKYFVVRMQDSPFADPESRPVHDGVALASPPKICKGCAHGQDNARDCRFHYVPEEDCFFVAVDRRGG